MWAQHLVGVRFSINKAECTDGALLYQSRGQSPLAASTNNDYYGSAIIIECLLRARGLLSALWLILSAAYNTAIINTPIVQMRKPRLIAGNCQPQRGLRASLGLFPLAYTSLGTNLPKGS